MTESKFDIRSKLNEDVAEFLALFPKYTELSVENKAFVEGVIVGLTLKEERKKTSA